ncbi:MAG: diguanylate cyclase domain-containing protein [Gammaproteobacteria bacterium]|jgi:diguanylate cyclase (GGDEF)-like protein
MKRYTKFFFRNIILIQFLLLSLGIIVSVIGSYFIIDKLLLSQALDNSRITVKLLNNTRNLYSQEVVARLHEAGTARAIPEYKDIHGAVPNPATFSIILGENLSTQNPGQITRLYSDHPFPNRIKTGGPRDEFEREAIDYLIENPQSYYARQDIVNGKKIFRYTEAIIMEEACVVCHNTLAESPKRDWKIGDVRGVIETTQNMDDLLIEMKSNFSGLLIMLCIISGLALLSTFLLMRYSKNVEYMIDAKVSRTTFKLKQEASSDPLTKLANRRKFDRTMEKEWKRLQRHQQTLSLLLCDVDHFKSYNDQYGHQAGDECLKKVAKILKKHSRRSGNLAARYGGEEFAIILPHVTNEEAWQLAEKIRTHIEEINITHEKSLTAGRITLSIGVASMIPDKENNIKKFINQADINLYKAKGQGRNQTVK